MSLTLGIVLYFIIWWTVLFAVLPFGIRTQAEEGRVVPGTPESAPAQPRLIRIFMINTFVAAVVFLGVWGAIVYRLIPIQEMPALIR